VDLKKVIEAIKVRPNNIDALIRHQSGETLSHALAHNAGFAVMNSKTLFQQHRGGMRGKSLDTLLEGSITRKRKIVGIARVRRPGRSRETAQAAIDSIGADIGKRWGSWRTLWQVRTRIQAPRIS